MQEPAPPKATLTNSCPSNVAGSTMEKEKDLKHLNFVQTGSAAAVAHAEKAYSKLRTYTPAFASAHLVRVEESVTSAAAPLLTKAQDQAAQLLAYADGKVDVLLGGVDGTMTKGREMLGQAKAMNDANMEAFRTASASYYAFMSETADKVISSLNLKGVQESSMAAATKARESLANALEKAKELTDPDRAVNSAWEAWSKFASLSPIAQVLATAEPATKASMAAFTRLHDALVSAPLYKFAVSRTRGTITYATTTTPYKLGAHYLWPMVQPVADPAISKVSQSKVVSDVVSYWSPVVA